MGCFIVLGVRITKVTGDFLLAWFKGGRRVVTNYRLVVQVDIGFDQMIRNVIIGPKSTNEHSEDKISGQRMMKLLLLWPIIPAGSLSPKDPNIIVGRGIGLCGPVHVK